MDADIEATMPPTEQEEKLATLGGEELLDRYAEAQREAGSGRHGFAGDGLKRRATLRSEILRRLLLAEPPTFGGT